MMKTFQLTDEEYKKLIELYARAERAPMIIMQMGQPSWSEQAWDRVREYLNELGKKYGYVPETAQISKSKLEFQAQEMIKI